MIRKTLKRVARRALGRSAPEPAPSPRRPPYTPDPEPFDEDEDDLPSLEVDAAEARSWLEAGREPLLIDIREIYEVEAGHAEGAWLLPMNQIPHELAKLPRDRPLVIYCAAGVRSFGVAGYLREQGFEDSWSLIGGVGAWIDAGGRWLQPPSGEDLRLLRPVMIAREALADRGIQVDADWSPGVIQAVERPQPGEPGGAGGASTPATYSALLHLGDGPAQLIQGLARDELKTVGRTPR